MRFGRGGRQLFGPPAAGIGENIRAAFLRSLFFRAAVCGDGAFLDLVLTFGEKGITRLGYESSLNAKASVSASASASSVLLSAEVSNSAYLVADFAYDESVEVESVPNPSEFQEQKDLLG